MRWTTLLICGWVALAWLSCTWAIVALIHAWGGLDLAHIDSTVILITVSSSAFTGLVVVAILLHCVEVEWRQAMKV